MVDVMYNNSILGMGRGCFEGDGVVGPICSGLLRTSCSFRGVQDGLEIVVGMAVKNPFSREGNHSSHPPHWLGGDRGAGRSGEEEAEERVNGLENEDSG